MSKQTDELVKLTYEIHSRALVLHQTLSDSGSLRKEENAIQMNKNPELASILSEIKFPVRYDSECISDSCLHICGYHIAIEWGDAFDTKEKQDAFGEELARLINTLDPTKNIPLSESFNDDILELVDTFGKEIARLDPNRESVSDEEIEKEFPIKVENDEYINHAHLHSRIGAKWYREQLSK